MQQAVRPRILLWTDCVLTSGHINATSRLARALADRGCEVCLVSGREAFAKMKGFPYSGIECATCPSLLPNVSEHNPSGVKTPNELDYEDDPDFQNERARYLIEKYESFRPDIVVTEYWPSGAYFEPESRALFEHIRSQPNPAQLVAYQRDFTPKPERRHRSQEELADLLDRFDAVLVRGDEKLTPYRLTLGEAVERINAKLTYTGYPFDADEIASHGPGGEVVVSIGGAYPPGSRETLHAILAARAEASPEIALALWHVFVSKQCSNADREFLAHTATEIENRLRQRFPNQPIPDCQIEANNPHFAGCLKQAKLAILRGGLSAAEAAIMHRPCVIIPYVHETEGREHSEQIIRAEAMAQALPSIQLYDTERLNDTAGLAHAMNTAVANTNRAREYEVKSKGHHCTADEILTLHERAKANAMSQQPALSQRPVNYILPPNASRLKLYETPALSLLQPARA